MTSTLTTLDTLTMRIASLERAAERIVAIELETTGHEELPHWSAGSHVNVHLADGLVRQYSLSLAPGTLRWRLGVLEEVDSRGGSRYVHHCLEVGDTLAVSKPRNNFSFEVRDKNIVFVAGGIGITPILSMIAAAVASDADWTLLYLTRSPESTAFSNELAIHESRVRHHYDSIHGTVDLATELDAVGAATADIYACGPSGLLTALEGYAGARSLCRLTIERFTSSGTEPRTGDHEFTVELADGTEVPVAADESILDALTRAGVRVLSSCREGVCGTCETQVISGVPDHRDQILSDEERQSGDTMMPCVSRCLGRRLTLDL